MKNTILTSLLLISFQVFANNQAVLKDLAAQSEQLSRECSDSSCGTQARQLFREYQKIKGGYAYITADSPNNKLLPAVLLIHSYTMSSEEMRDIANMARRRGMAVVAVQLEGHEGTESDLGSLEKDAWIRDARIGLNTAIQLGNGQVVIAGYSLGGLLASYVAIERPQTIAGLVLIGPAIQLKYSAMDLACVGRALVKTNVGAKLAGLVAYGRFHEDAYVTGFVAGSCAIYKLILDFRSKIRKISPASSLSAGRGKATITDNNYELIQNMFSKATFPVLLMYTEEDEILSGSALRVLGQHLPPGSRVVKKDTSHLALIYHAHKSMESFVLQARFYRSVQSPAIQVSEAK